jgi:signal transduction histidine kinase
VTSEPGPPSLRLLVVDDDEVDRMAVVRNLGSAGMPADFTEAEDLKTALETIRDDPPDCVFLDFNLPDGTALDMLREVRGAGVRVPIVILTGQGDEQLAVDLMKAGASDYLPKNTLSADRLAQSLRYVMRVYRAETTARAAEESREAAIAARSRFYAAMSHELRTPINAILGYNDLLLSSIYGELAPKQRHGVERAQKAARHLLELVNDALDLSKLELGKLELQLEPVSIPALVEDLFATIRPLAADHHCELAFEVTDCPRPILTDSRRVRQILLNLLSNAIKYGENQPVHVHCSALPDGGVRVEVRDRGEGIANEDLTRVFEEFVQLHHSKHGGTGLGLSISKRLAELLHGRLEVESSIGEGSTFRLVLPPEPPATMLEAQAEEASLRPRIQ